MSQKREVTFSGESLEQKPRSSVESALLIADDVWREAFGLPGMKPNERLRADKLAKRSQRRSRRGN